MGRFGESLIEQSRTRGSRPTINYQIREVYIYTSLLRGVVHAGTLLPELGEISTVCFFVHSVAGSIPVPRVLIGRPIWFDTCCTTRTAYTTKRLKLKHDKLLLRFAFNFNLLRRYNQVATMKPVLKPPGTRL